VAWGYTDGDLPVTEKAAREILSLPMFPGLTAGQQQRIADGIAAFAIASSTF
jgi:dTDP-4-amino-4,6-dideoxygalactose transaminase